MMWNPVKTTMWPMILQTMPLNRIQQTEILFQPAGFGGQANQLHLVLSSNTIARNANNAFAPYRKITWNCAVCEVPLCKVRRFGDRSCFDLFHESEQLFYPCGDHGQDIAVRPHANRPPPPVRARRRSSVSSEEGHAGMYP